MIGFASKNSARWVPLLKTNATYFNLFNRALDNLEMNKREENAYTLSFVLQTKNKKAGF
jgi:hypothetical protein